MQNFLLFISFGVSLSGLSLFSKHFLLFVEKYSAPSTSNSSHYNVFARVVLQQCAHFIINEEGKKTVKNLTIIHLFSPPSSFVKNFGINNKREENVTRFTLDFSTGLGRLHNAVVFSFLLHQRGNRQLFGGFHKKKPGKKRELFGR